MPNRILPALLSAALLAGSLVGCTSDRPAREGVDPDWTYRDAGASLTFSSVWDEDVPLKPVDEQIAIAKGIDLY